MRRLAILLALGACGRIGFDAVVDGANPIGSDADTTPPTAFTEAAGMVDTAGVVQTDSEPDGTHLVFVDNTPGMNGDLVIFREGDRMPTIRAYVSIDHGATWTRYALAPTNAVGLNAMGACQDTIDHAFHLAWLDTTNLDQYATWKPMYTNGDIAGFAFGSAFSFFDDGNDSPGPRDISEIVDASGNHRLVFAGTGPSTGSTGIYKLAVTTPTAGVEPASQADWAKATDHGQSGSDDQLLANDYPTGDGPDSYLVSVSSNLAGGTAAPIVVVGGFPVDKKLLAWTITPAANDDFAISAATTVTATFGASALRGDASLSLASMPSGGVVIAYGASGGVHVAEVDPSSGAIVADAAPPPTASTSARHAVIATDAASRPAVLYADGATIFGTLLWNGAWLPAAQVAQVTPPAAAWNVSDVWTVDGDAYFGMYSDAGSGSPTTFSRVSWH
ncbi:MAG TPA: hypothetical protein VH143_34035 [Kofleriaceae bacterium]|nr:hypothetical protein [Kofleriaceae bacterium]